MSQALGLPPRRPQPQKVHVEASRWLETGFLTDEDLSPPEENPRVSLEGVEKAVKEYIPHARDPAYHDKIQAVAEYIYDDDRVQTSGDATLFAGKMFKTARAASMGGRHTPLDHMFLRVRMEQAAR